MKKTGLILIAAVMTLLFSIRPSLAADGDASKDYRPNDDVLLTMSYPQAKIKIESMENRGTYYGVADLLKNIKISPDKVTWTCVRSDGYWWSYTSYFKSMKIGAFPSLSSEHGMGYRVEVGIVTKTQRANKTPMKSDHQFFIISSNEDEAVSLADAFYVLKRYAEGYKPEDGSFSEGAAAWRALAVKPELPEDVLGCRMAAEEAFKNKDFKKALDYYKKGLSMEPFWPQGLFNAAVLEGELGSYKSAVFHMKRYLELLPDAPNAKAAREKMSFWKIKGEEQQ